MLILIAFTRSLFAVVFKNDILQLYRPPITIASNIANIIRFNSFQAVNSHLNID